MKKYLVKTIVLSLPVLLVLVSVNYWGDAARIFDNQYEANVAAIIRKGSNVTNISANFDERIFQRELIKTINFQPDIVVIGSSRTFLINNDYFRNKRLVNSSVVGARLEDITAIYQLYRNQNITPHKIILAIDPWLFNENNQDHRWESISEAHFAFLRQHNKPVEKERDFFNAKYFQLVSPSYFQSSLKNIPRQLKRGIEPVPTKGRYNTTKTRLSDGSLIYDKGFRESTEEEIRERVRKYTAGKVYNVEGFVKLSPRILDLFYTLMNDMKANKIEVEFFLAPYHPDVYRVIKSRYLQVLRTEELINDYAKKEGINVIGSFNPQVAHLDGSHFYDGMHCKESGIKILMAERLLAQNSRCISK